MTEAQFEAAKKRAMYKFKDAKRNGYSANHRECLNDQAKFLGHGSWEALVTAYKGATK